MNNNEKMNESLRFSYADPTAPILIVKLRPNDSFKCMMSASLAIGESDTIYSACSNAWATYDEEIKDFIIKMGSSTNYTTNYIVELSVLSIINNIPIIVYNDLNIPMYIFDKGLVDLHKLMERSGDKDYHVSFFGGEPLLNFDLIKIGRAHV